MNRKKLLEIPICEKPKKLAPDIPIAVSQVIRKDDPEEPTIVNIDLYYNGSLRARWFGGVEEEEYWIYFMDTGWKRMKLENAGRVIQDMQPVKDTYYSDDSYEWASRDDRCRVDNELVSVNYFEYEVYCKRKNTAYERKVERIDKLMAAVPVVPEDAEQWIHEKIFPEEYLFIKTGKKRTDYYCTACRTKGWTKMKWKHNEVTQCPKCGKYVSVKSRARKTERKEKVTLLQKMNKLTWVERIFWAVCQWSREGKEISLYEEIRAVIPIGQTYGKVYYGQEVEQDEFLQEWWDSNSYSKKWGPSFLYPGNLQEVLPMGSLQNSGMDILANKGRKFEVNKFIMTFHSRGYMEYLIKGGFMKMAAEIVNIYGWWRGEADYLKTDGTTYKELFGIDGNRVNRLKQMDGGMIALRWLQYEEAAGIRISQETLEYLEQHKISPSDMDTFINELGSVNRVVNYMRKQSTRPLRTLELWGDYIRMAEQEGLDLQDDIVRFPRELKARHDAMASAIYERQDKAQKRKERAKYRKIDKQIAEHLPDAKVYFYENQEYIFIPAGRCEELVEEGRTLHHCVGASDIYMNRMAEGKTWIVFLRRKNNIDIPYYTLEINMENDIILQWYSEYDRKPDEKAISKLLTEYKNAIRRERVSRKTQTEIMVSA